MYKDPYKGMELYVFRYVKNGKGWRVANSKPCRECVKIIKKAKIRKVHYTMYKDDIFGIMTEKVEYLQNIYITTGNRSRK